MASPGIAALLIHNCHTAHSMLKIPIKVNETTTCVTNRGSVSADFISKSKLFVWDEAPMMSKYVYETFGRTFIDIMKAVDPKLELVAFGGKLNKFRGDFRLMLSVVRHGNSEQL